MKLHIFGASGSGTTTLGRGLAAELGLMHLDSDDFFWEATDPPYTRRRPTPERQQRLSTAFTSAPDG
jgi:adenylate kinase family enzyme